MKNKLITLSCVTILMLQLTAPAGYGQTLTALVSFAITNGALPLAGLVQGSDGNFYGTTSQTFSTNDIGTIFKMTPAGALTTLVAFNGTNGANPRAGLLQGNDGNFYGTTAGITESDPGMIFKMTPAGELTKLVSFNGTNGAAPQAGRCRGAMAIFMERRRTAARSISAQFL